MDQARFENEPVPLTFELLSEVPDLIHGVFSRHGGVSRAPFGTLNTSWSVGDSGDAVRENFLRIKSALKIEHLVETSQVHGDTIRIVDEDAIAGAEARPPVLVVPPGDALITSLKGIGLMIKIADCQAVFLVDPVRRVIANVHSGWRGSVLEILSKVVGVMEQRFGSHPADLLASISPSLGPCCAEFRGYRTELPVSLHSFQVRPDYFDFWAISRMQLTGAGLSPKKIEVAGRCTVCGSNDFFSYRAHGTTGRMAAVLAWKGIS